MSNLQGRLMLWRLQAGVVRLKFVRKQMQVLRLVRPGGLAQDDRIMIKGIADSGH